MTPQPSGTGTSPCRSLLNQHSLSAQPFASKPCVSQPGRLKTRKHFTTIQPHGKLQILCDHWYYILHAPCTDVCSSKTQSGLDRYLGLCQIFRLSHKEAIPNCTFQPQSAPTNYLSFSLKHSIQHCLHPPAAHAQHKVQDAYFWLTFECRDSTKVKAHLRTNARSSCRRCQYHRWYWREHIAGQLLCSYVSRT